MMKFMMDIATVVVGAVLAVIAIVGMLAFGEGGGVISDYTSVSPHHTHQTRSHPGNGGMTPRCRRRISDRAKIVSSLLCWVDGPARARVDYSKWQG